MTPARWATVTLLSGRIAYGVGLAVAPERLAGGKWLGAAASSEGAQVAIRGIGAREIALHGAAVVAALRGAPLHPWLAASIVGDVADIASTAIARGSLPRGSAPATALVAGISAALSAAALAATR